MEFDKSRVYTAVNADELEVGSKVYTADCLGTLQQMVEVGLKDKVTTIREIESVDYGGRFYDGIACWHLAYLVSEPEEKKLKWTDLKIGDVIRYKESGVEYLVTGLDKRDKRYHIYAANTWISDDSLERNWEKVGE